MPSHATLIARILRIAVLATALGLAACDDDPEPAPPPLQTPSLSLSASPALGDAPLSVTLSWAAITVSACNASGAWSGARDVSGTETVTLTTVGSHLFTLDCSGPNGNATRSATVTTTDPFTAARAEFDRLRALESTP